MSFNSWDKLVKARRDFPKTKFATAVVDKALKKAPSNVYLLVCIGGTISIVVFLIIR